MGGMRLHQQLAAALRCAVPPVGAMKGAAMCGMPRDCTPSLACAEQVQQAVQQVRSVIEELQKDSWQYEAPRHTQH